MIRARSLPIVLCVAVHTASAAFAQGPIIPTGTPAPTMKTLDQVEARIPIPGGTTSVTLNNDGSYYLTGNVSVASGNGIVVFADNVTLDLNGFSIGSAASPAAGAAINCAGTGSVVVRNGTVRGTVTVNPSTGAATGTGFQTGVQISSAAVGLIENVRVTGVTGNGISLSGSAGTVSRCQTINTGLYGIYANGGTVDHCVASNCGTNGIQANVITDCQATAYIGTAINANHTAENCQGNAQNTSGAAVYGINAQSAVNCRGQSVSATAVNATSATNCVGDASVGGTGVSAKTARGCSGTSVTGIGVNATVAADCYGNSGSSFGISTTNASNCYGNSGSSVGILCQTALNCVGTAGGMGTGSEGIDCGSGSGVATGCYGTAGTATGYSIRAKLAIGCTLGVGNQTGIANKINTF